MHYAGKHKDYHLNYVGRFAFNTPFTPSGKAHGDVTEQYMRKTILTSMECFPYVKKRSEVVKLDTVYEIINIKLFFFETFLM